MPDVQQQVAVSKLVHAGIALTSLQPFDGVLQTLVDTARDIVDARYGALAVIDPGTQHVGDLFKSGSITKARDDGLHVAILARGRVFGNLFINDKIAGDFTADDRVLLQMLASLAAAAVETAQLRQERDRFFAAASHELGNAVAGVRVWAEHLSEKVIDPDVQRGLEHVRKGADTAHRLIDDLLSLARIQEGRLKLVPWRVDVSALMIDVVAQYRPEMENATLRIDVAGVQPAMITQADATRVRQIFVNLIGNALKFSPPRSLISVGVHCEGNQLRAWVADHGPGVAAADVDRIFKPYEQVSGLARGRGAGLGLPLSRQLARLMGGDLWVETGTGGGSRFVFSLPVRV